MPAQVCYLYRMFALGQTLSCNGKVNQHKAGICTPSPSDLMALATMLDNAARDGSHKYVEGPATAVV